MLDIGCVLTVGIVVAMAGCVMHVPAVSAKIGRFTRIFTDIVVVRLRP